MKIKEISVLVTEDDLPIGKWAGQWRGYVVTFETNVATYRLDVDEGVRGTAEVWVYVDMDSVRVEPLEITA